MNRRGFLASATAAVTAPVLPRLAAAGPVGAAVSLVICDISPETDAAKLGAVVETLVENSVWPTCAVRLPSEVDQAYRATLEMLASYRFAVEIALEIEDLAALSPYFQARAAHDLSERVRDIGGAFAQTQALTMLCQPREAPTRPEGVRTAGYRNVLVRPGSSGPMEIEHWPNGVVRFFGGNVIHPWSAKIPVDGEGTTRLTYASAAGFNQIAEPDLRRWAAEIAQRLRAAEEGGRISVMPVSEIQFRDDYEFTRYIAVQLVGAPTGYLAELGDWLAEEGIAFRYVAEAEAGDRLFWVSDPAEVEQSATVLSLAPDCSLAAAPSGCGALPPGVKVRPAAVDAAASGLDGSATLRLRELRLDQPVSDGQALSLPGPAVDFVLSIHPGAVASRFDIRTLQAALVELRYDGVTAFVDVGDMANGLLFNGPIDARYRRTVAARANGPEASSESGAGAALMDDARRAWAFFEKYTDPRTGLCPATVDITPGGETLKTMTMWDVGSQINALVAARELGIIGEETFDPAVGRILYQIAGREVDRRRLPPGWIRTDRSRVGNRDFDGCDAGRLLAALSNLSQNSSRGEEIAQLVASWSLPEIVIDGEIHSIVDGRLASTYASHCAHYATRAFELWGLPSRSPYRTFDGRSRADGEMALLEEVAGIGPLGAEPLLHEAVELGMSPEAAFLADVLFYAQVEETAASGRLMGVSETPIKEPPWFIYLGLQLGREAREWGSDTVGREPEYRTREFVERQMAVSSKAAFLWAAYRPGAYSDALVDLVRSRARLDYGFASNVNIATGRPTQNYTDVNTNGLILQAIAHIVRRNG